MHRAYRRCRACQVGVFPADDRFGTGRFLTARAVIAAIESAKEFGRAAGSSRRLGRPDDGPLTTPGDGSEWVWNLVARRFAKAEQVLDISHAVGHGAELGRAGLGTDGESKQGWLDQARHRLPDDGWNGLCEFLVTGSGEVPDRATMAAALPALANDLVGHRDRLGCAVRLARGQSIGSGLVEGTVKQWVIRRMKRSWARQRAEGVGRFVELCVIADGPEWCHNWSSAD